MYLYFCICDDSEEAGWNIDPLVMRLLGEQTNLCGEPSACLPATDNPCCYSYLYLSGSHLSVFGYLFVNVLPCEFVSVLMFINTHIEVTAVFGSP